MSSRLLLTTAASSGGSFGFCEYVQWNLCILSINFSKLVHGCYDGAAFYSSQLPMYVALYCMLYHLVWRQSTTSSTSHSLWALWSLSFLVLIETGNYSTPQLPFNQWLKTVVFVAMKCLSTKTEKGGKKKIERWKLLLWETKSLALH